MPRYTEQQLAEAIDALWEIVKDILTEPEIEDLCTRHPAIDEISDFGPNGPCGIGLGRFGGHAVGDGD